MPEQAAMAVSAPLMATGLVAAALANGWIERLGGGTMVIGASMALALTGRRVRRVAWAVAMAGGLMALTACF